MPTRRTRHTAHPHHRRTGDSPRRAARTRSHRLEIQVHYQGTWYDAGSDSSGPGTNGVSGVRYTGDHGQEVGYRLRSSHINGSSGGSVNSTTYGSWKYFLFTK
ncbi:hypothetical protein [Streptomyces griseoluteus]|uniref:hypothetical protein n=1 Tax=Streptomyces griseoluteus TaxID=29306 RepID=UPI0036B64B81